MDNDLISRSALEKSIRAYADDVGPRRGEYEMANGILKSLSKVKSAPSANSVQRGFWTWHEEWTQSTTDGPAECQNAGWECSKCKIDLADYLSDAIGETLYVDNQEQPPKIKICPNCGALMCGGQDDG